MANVIVQDHHLSDIRKERQNNTGFIEKLSTSGTCFMITCLVYNFMSKASSSCFPKISKCFALKQVQCATVIQYMSRVPFKRMIVPPFSIPVMSMALQTLTHPEQLNLNVSCRGRPSRCFWKNLSL